MWHASLKYERGKKSDEMVKQELQNKNLSILYNKIFLSLKYLK